MQHRNYNLAFILTIVGMDTLGFGIIYPILPKLIGEITGAGLSKAAVYGGWLTLAYALFQFLSAPVIGKLSDRFGRRPVLLISLLAFAIDCLFLAFTQHIIWFFIGRALAGIAGASYAAAAASIADISNEKNRTQYFGYINAAYASGFIIGPALGGILGDINTRLPFLVAALICLVNLVFGFFFFRETLPKRKRQSISEPIKIGMRLAGIKSFKPLYPLFMAALLVSIAGHSMPSVWAYFTMEKFSWNARLVGYSLAFLGILSLVVQVYGVRLMSRRFGDYRMTTIGIAFSILGLLCIAFSFHVLLLIPALILYNFGSINRAGFQALTSKGTREDRQGELQGIIGSLNGLALIIGPLLMTQTFGLFTNGALGYFPGFPYLLAAILFVLAWVILASSKRAGSDAPF